MNRKSKAIAIGKFGQKLIFNRNSRECQRSNTNGNVGAYLFFKMLIETNPYDLFVVVGENDLSSFDIKPYHNVVDGTQYSLDELVRMDLDYGILNIGLLKEHNPDDILMTYINKSNINWLLASDDPRCLDTKAQDFINLPNKIVSQFEGKINFAGKEYDVEYYGIERANAYECNFTSINNYRQHNFIIIANTAGDYDRISKVEDFTRHIPFTEIYGRVDKEVMTRNEKFKGEVDFKTINHIMDNTKLTFVVPIKENWVTSKYIEVLNNGALPIFYKDYNTELLNVDLIDVVRTPSDLRQLVKFYLENEEARRLKVERLREELVSPYYNGKILSNLLINTCNIFKPKRK